MAIFLLSHPESQRFQRRKRLCDKVVSIFHEHKKRYGRLRLYREMRNQGEEVSEKIVGQIMQSQGLCGLRKKAFRPEITLHEEN